MFASRSTDTIPIPFAVPAATCTLRPLTGKECDEAQEAHLRATIGGRWSAHGWAAQFQQQLAKGTATEADAAKVLADPLAGYDRHTIVKRGLTAWSIADPALSAEAIDDLTDEPLEWFAREILRRTKPALFETVAERELVKKTGSAPSSVA
jgi:hypothetical protein